MNLGRYALQQRGWDVDLHRLWGCWNEETIHTEMMILQAYGFSLRRRFDCERTYDFYGGAVVLDIVEISQESDATQFLLMMVALRE